VSKQPPSVFSVELEGPGPFQLPLLEKFISLESPLDKDLVVAQFESTGGMRIFAAISYLAAEQLAKGYSPQRLAAKPKHAPRLVDLWTAADAYELPKFSSFEGYVLFGGFQTLVLSTEQHQPVWFPLSSEAYDDLLGHIKAALVFYLRAKRIQ